MSRDAHPCRPTGNKPGKLICEISPLARTIGTMETSIGALEAHPG